MAEETASASTPAESPKKKGGMLGKIILIIIVLAVIGGGVYYANNSTKAAAVVNGETISMAEYTERFNRIAATITAQGGSATTTEMQTAIKNEALKNLVDEELVLQAAKKENIVAKSSEVDTQLSQTKTQFGDDTKYKDALTKQGYNETTFRDFLTRMNIVQQYLAAHVSTSTVKASETEVKSLYDQAKQVNKNLPPLASVRAQVEQQIVTQKQQQLVDAEVEKLRSASKIEILVK
jgi:hypothetical protein